MKESEYTINSGKEKTFLRHCAIYSLLWINLMYLRTQPNIYYDPGFRSELVETHRA